MSASIDSRWVTVQGLRIHCLAAGTGGPPVLLLHGGTIDCAAMTYLPAIQALSANHRVFAPDLPGHGESDPPPPPHTTAAYLDLLRELVDALHLPQAALVGFSITGTLALGFALQAPTRVQRLVLVSSYGLGSATPYLALSYLFVRLPRLVDLVRRTARRDDGFLRLVLRLMLCDHRGLSPDLVVAIRRELERHGAGEAWRLWQRSESGPAGLHTSYLHRLPELRVPTLIVHGACDRFVPVAWARRAHRLIPGSRLVVFPRCGHWPQQERPRDFVRVLAAFLG